MILNRRILWLGFSLCGIAVFSIVSSCGGSKSTDTDEENTVADSTEKMVKAVCSSCHEWVPPEMLPRVTWTDLVLPVMAGKMGFTEYEGVPLPSEKNDPAVSKNFYPSKPTITYSQFKEIVEYFKIKAPETTPSQQRELPIGVATSRFQAQFPNLPPTDPPLTTYVKIQPNLKRLVAGVGGDHPRLGLFDENLQPKWVMSLPSAPAHIDYSGGMEWLITCMGSVMPSNKKEGKLIQAIMAGDKQPSKPKELFTALPRPVQIQKADLDGNGVNDYLINGFGHLEGKLYWLKDGKSGAENMFRADPGALRSVVVDWDGDGKQDVVTMFAQGRESIFLYKNEGGGKFTEKKLMAFMPVMGSSFFDIMDVNGDKKPDIVYTSGDNADYSIALKHFHGVYIYLNQGNDQFKQAYFYPIHGCYKAMLRDFDLDGDLDMVTISFFADYVSQHQEALVYFENQGDLKFVPYQMPGFDRGRWLTMDAGDLDGDGDEDVVIGNFAYGPESFLPAGAPQKFASHPIYLYLENTTK
jgi:hypothetical protein